MLLEKQINTQNRPLCYTIEPWKCGGNFNGKRIVGEVHTHPYSSKFSDRDILAISQNIAVLGADYKAYLVCPDLSVRIFDPTSHNPQNGIFVGTFTPKTRKLYGGSNIISRTHILR